MLQLLPPRRARAADVGQAVGVVPCGDDSGAAGWVRIHANFGHHRDGALRLLGLPEGSGCEQADLRPALCAWSALDFEQAAPDAGLVVAALRSFDAWDRHGQGRALATQPLVHLQRIGDAPPRALPPLPAQARPLEGVRVLDLTRILAGQVGTCALAAYGADVLLVNAPQLPNIEAIAETSRSKLSAHAELRDAGDRATFEPVLRHAHVLVQGYRPRRLAATGLRRRGAGRTSSRYRRRVAVGLGPGGPWSQRRGFDSLVQTASGFNVAEAQACGRAPARTLPMQILDHASGYLIALGACAALQRQQSQGGSSNVQVSLARTALWLRGLGRVEGGFDAAAPEFAPYVETHASGFDELTALRHAAMLSATPAAWSRPSMPPGTHALAWRLCEYLQASDAAGFRTCRSNRRPRAAPRSRPRRG
jgi:hypothetical protein